MKKLMTVFFVGVFVVSCASKSDNSQAIAEETDYVELPADKYNAVQVNNQISSIQKGTLAIIDSVFKADTSKIELMIKDAIFEVDVSISRLKSVGETHEVASYFSEAVIDLLKYYKKEFETNFLALLPVLKQKKISEKDQELLGAYDQKFVEQEAILFEEIVARQDSFALFFDIGLAN